MKVTINTTAPQSREIDWSKKMLVKFKEADIYVLTTGDYNNDYFTGVRLGDNVYADDFLKHKFTPCTTPVTITFENEL